MPPVKVKQLGRMGVNVDKDAHELDDNELRQAQNAIHEPLGLNAGIVNRPGLVAFNTSTLSDDVLGGVGVPLPDMTANGEKLIFIGRGDTV